MTVSARFAAANSAALNTPTAVSVSWATPAVAGDRMYAVLATISATAAPSTPTGWTVEKAFAAHSTFFGEAVYSKVAVGGETSVSLTLGTGTRWAMGVAILSGADAPGASGARAETSRTSPVPATSAALVFPQLTPTYDQAFLLELSAIRYEGGATPGSASIPDTNWTEQIDTCTTNTSGAQVGVLIGKRQRGASTNGVQTTAVTATTSPNSLNVNSLYAFPATAVADPSAVPANWHEVRVFQRA